MNATGTGVLQALGEASKSLQNRSRREFSIRSRAVCGLVRNWRTTSMAATWRCWVGAEMGYGTRCRYAKACAGDSTAMMYLILDSTPSGKQTGRPSSGPAKCPGSTPRSNPGGICVTHYVYIHIHADIYTYIYIYVLH